MTQVSIFVSHSHQDNEWCRSFVAALKAVGYDMWYDESGLTGGAAWVGSIQREVQARDVFLVVLTPEAWASQWVQDELQLAIATRRRILPVLLRNCQVDGFLLTTQWVTVIGEEPQTAARSVIIAVEAPPAPGRNVGPQKETLDELLTLCRSLASEKRYTEALSACGRALALDPVNVDALTIRAGVLLSVNEPYNAAETWSRALSLAQGERVKKIARDMQVQLYERLERGTNSAELEEVRDIVANVASQVTTGMALYEVFKEYSASSSGLFGDHIREIAAEGQNFDVVRAALTIAQDTRQWELVCLLTEGYYGYPPDKATSADIDVLKRYRDALRFLEGFNLKPLAVIGQVAVVGQYIQRLAKGE